MPRKNYPSDESRKRIARELERINDELDALERELRVLWLVEQADQPGERTNEAVKDA
ncbi:hypothetical protein [Actinocorallia aurantiaca]|uniref:Transposase n=1 Tax=Actinocorallia aurantiaca TaxID=46204 RepID=A0ABN3UNC2_9ACTN